MKKTKTALALAAALLFTLSTPAMAASEGPPAWLVGDLAESEKTPLASAPEDGTPEDGTPEDGTPEDGTPEDGTPEDGTPEDGTPEDVTPEDGTPEDGTPEDGTPEDGTPEDGTPEDGTPEDSTPEDGTPEGTGDTPSGLILVTDDHTAYITGSAGSFHPQDSITRAEAAQILCRLLPEGTSGSAAFTDVPESAWYAQAAGTLGSLGVMRAGESTFQPDEAITRGEFIRSVACFFPARADADQFPDVPAGDPDAPYILTARSWGWLSGFDDGTVRPGQTLTRAEAVAMLNRALGRSPDKAYIDSACPVFYLDVSRDNWFYYEVAEASVTHRHAASDGVEYWLDHTPIPAGLETGFHLVDGWLYYYDGEQDQVVRSAPVGSFTFDASGHFTTGNADLDGRLREIVLSKTTPDMNQEQKLRALYIYTRDSFTYLRRPAYAFGAAGFMEQDALNMLQTGYGNCYSYASLFWYLSRWIGYDSIIYSGTVGSNRAPHSWVEIAFDGKYHIFDTELEMAYHKKGRYEINLYKYIDVDGWQYRRPSTPS